MSNFDFEQRFTDLPSAETVAQEKINAAAAAAAAELRADADRKIGLMIKNDYVDRFIDSASGGI